MLKVLSRLFGRNTSFNPRQVSTDFRLFAHVNAARISVKIQRTGEFTPGMSYNELLILYIRERGKSPFAGDDQFQECNKFLLENGIL